MSRQVVELLWTNDFLGNPATHQGGVLIVDGYRVPGIQIRKSLDLAEDGRVSVVLDTRFAIDVTEAEVRIWGWMLANGMAFAAGFTSFGENARKRDSFFGSKVLRIDSVGKVSRGTDQRETVDEDQDSGWHDRDHLRPRSEQDD